MSGAADDGAMTKRRPNILWVVTTQWRASATGYAGDANARTPFLDALAAESVNYEQAVTPHPFGPFARAALLTGLMPARNGAEANHSRPRAELKKLPAYLQELGYEVVSGERYLDAGIWHQDMARTLTR